MAQGVRVIAVALLLAASSAAALGSAPLAADLLVRETTPALDFSATLAPEMALAPDLLAALRAEALAYRAKMEADSTAQMEDAKKAGFPARPYAVIQRWNAEAETPALLAFRGLLWEYTGGAHGNSNFAVVLYDRANGRRMTTADLFTDPKAALAALQKPWCAALAEARKARRGRNEPTMFDDCPALSDLPIVPVAAGQGNVTGMKVLAAPYVAGSYAEGSYELLVPADPVVPFLKPEWRASFGVTDQPGN